MRDITHIRSIGSDYADEEHILNDIIELKGDYFNYIKKLYKSLLV